MDDVQQLAGVTSTVEACPPAQNREPGGSLPSVESVEEISNYRHVPFQTAGTRSVRYGQIEPLRPRSLEYVEDDA